MESLEEGNIPINLNLAYVVGRIIYLIFLSFRSNSYGRAEEPPGGGVPGDLSYTVGHNHQHHHNYSTHQPVHMRGYEEGSGGGLHHIMYGGGGTFIQVVVVVVFTIVFSYIRMIQVFENNFCHSLLCMMK